MNCLTIAGNKLLMESWNIHLNQWNIYLYNCKWQARKFSVDRSAITRKRCNRKEDVNHETDLLEKRFYLAFTHNIGMKLTFLLLTFGKTVTEHKYSSSSNSCRRFLSEISYNPRDKLNEKALLKLVIKLLRWLFVSGCSKYYFRRFEKD